jgi:hypothetical protein
MKILYLPILVKGGANEQLDLIEAFRKAVGPSQLRIFDYCNFKGNPSIQLVKEAMNFRPDLIHMQLQETDKIQPFTVREIKRRFPSCIISQWNGDIRHYLMGSCVQVGKFIDFTLLSNEGHLPDYEKAIGKKCYYWQNAVGPRFYTTPEKERHGIAFVGNNYQDRFPNARQRIELRQALRKAFGKEFRTHGGGWSDGTVPLPWDKQPLFYRTSKVTVSHNLISAARYFSDRTLMMMVSGVPNLLHYVSGIEQDFEDSKEVLYWRTVPEAVEKAQWCLEHPGEADKIGQAGFAKIKTHHNWDVRVQQLQEILGVKFTEKAPPSPRLVPPRHKRR